jgi:hypothetical protein
MRRAPAGTSSATVRPISTTTKAKPFTLLGNGTLKSQIRKKSAAPVATATRRVNSRR